MITTYMIIICFSALLFSAVGTACVRYVADLFAAGRAPNARDNHKRPTPKGGGVAVMLSAIGFLSVVGMNGTVLWAFMLLTVISCIDDMQGLSPLSRLVFHAIAAAMMVGELHAPLFADIMPYMVEYILLTLALVWFINLYNFMDGIDEITSLSTSFIMIGLISITVLHPQLPDSFFYDSLIVVSSVAGFWYFNRHPATIFLGDSGSIGLGGVVGWLLLSLAAHGMWEQALMLPAYYLVDSGITMMQRLAKGHKPWEAHSEHGYQRFVRAGHRHSQATRLLAFYNMMMVVLVGVSTHLPDYAPYCVAATYVLAIALYGYFISKQASETSSHTSSVTPYASS